MKVLISALCAIAALGQDVRRLSILHSNDLHARLLPDDKKLGGFAYFSSVVNAERAGCSYCLYLDAGDLVQGSPVSTMFKGLPIFEIANSLHLDAATLGNHEFDYGWRQIPLFLKVAKFPIVSANVVNDSGQRIARREYVIRKVNGIRVAIIGVAMEDLASGFLTSVTSGPWKAQPVAEAARRVSAALKGRADVIIVLGHIHQKEGTQVLQTVPDVDVVIEGHDHAGRKEMLRIEDRVAVGCQAYGRELCRLDLDVKMPEGKIVNAKWTRLPVDSTKVSPDPVTERLVQKWEARVAAQMDVCIATAERTLTRPEVGKLLRKAVQEEMKVDFSAYVPSSGGIRDVLSAGPVLVRHIWNIFPFDNQIMIGRAKGSQLGKFLAEDERVEPDKEYSIAASDFLVNNPDSRESLGLGGVSFQPTPEMTRDVLIRWIKRQDKLQ